MSAKSKIVNILSESAVDSMTAGQIAEAAGLSISAVNAQIPGLLERRIIQYSGDIVTAGRYAKQYCISEYGASIAESEHSTVLLESDKASYVPEQILVLMEERVTEIMSRLEKFLGEIDARQLELHTMLKNAVVESIAMARITAAPVPPPVAEKPAPVPKVEDAVWQLKNYEDGEDIKPLVAKLKNYKTYRSWLDRRVIEYGAEDIDHMPPSVIPVVNKIAMAAMAQHGWSIPNG